MSMTYFRLHDDVYIADRWELGDLKCEAGTQIDGFDFDNGIPTDFDGSLRVSLRHTGRALDYSHLVGAPVPIVSRRVSEALISLAADDIQIIPARIDGQADEYYLINVMRTVKCIDDTASLEVKYWRPEDGRPEKIGGYRAVHGMRVDPKQIASDIKMFRPQGWTVVLIVSEVIRHALERIDATGTQFTPV